MTIRDCIHSRCGKQSNSKLIEWGLDGFELANDEYHLFGFGQPIQQSSPSCCRLSTAKTIIPLKSLMLELQIAQKGTWRKEHILPVSGEK